MVYNSDPSKITYLGTTSVRGQQYTRFGIRAEDRARHLYVIGKTGVGKSTLLETIAIQDIRNGEGLIFLDPHGSSADLLLQFIPHERIQDTIYFAPFDADYPIAFNIMEDIGYDKRHLVVSSLLSAFKKIWTADSWSSRMEHILSNTLLALLEYPNTTLLDINRMYAIPEFRKQVVARITDPQVRSFWIDEFGRYTDRFAAEATPAIQNKIGQFTSNPLIRNIIGQPKSAFDFRSAMDQRKIILINLSKGRIGEGNASLLGILFSTKVYLSALSRAESTREELQILPTTNLFVDEFQSFASDTFADILSEARKYKLHLVLAHQYIEQMPEEVRSAVFGNVGTTISFRVGPFDGEKLTKVYADAVSMNDLANLGKRQIYISLMIDGTNSPVFLAQTLDMFTPPHTTYASAVRDYTRNTYGSPRVQVERIIAERLEEFSSNTKEKSKERQTITKRKEYFKNNQNHPPYQKTEEQIIVKKEISATLQNTFINIQQKESDNIQQNNTQTTSSREKQAELVEQIHHLKNKQEIVGQEAQNTQEEIERSVNTLIPNERIPLIKKEEKTTQKNLPKDNNLHSFDDEWKSPSDILSKFTKE